MDRNGRQRQETVWVQPVQSGRRGSGCSRGDIQSCRHRRRRNPGRQRPPASPDHHRHREVGVDGDRGDERDDEGVRPRDAVHDPEGAPGEGAEIRAGYLFDVPVRFAEDSPYPDPATVTDDVYA